MSKETKKNRKYTYDQRIIKALVEKYGLTTVYVRQCLSGNNLSITADKIKSDYKEIDKAFQAITTNLLKH
ncbi:hypothetical protein [Flavobacterium phragmitis]|uniref:Uncharacterized protein n=1 Tax=Flavobacterium phragmitis TaxID=739143 RepID=A0A1I1PJG1_9FLAO|nr:hypothetical protein [Flavobacterium phragmitis]SFD09989.1 hypothetical protein SAMN05216297_104202 [Flavobacterium phragmitis]